MVANNFGWCTDYELFYASIIGPWDRDTVSILHAHESPFTAREW